MYSLPPLPYDAAALRPVIGEETMLTHHGKHHARYVETVNELLHERAGARPLEDVIAEARERGDSKLFANAAQAWNHAFFWESMTPSAATPAAPLQGAITASFGSLGALKDAFVAEGAGHFGSGWVWLMAANDGLEVVSSHDADQPWLASDGTPLLVCDVWEHAYYLDYKNERDRFLRAWFDELANWDFAAEQLAATARGGTGYRYPLSVGTRGTANATRPSSAHDPR
jgi:Fe-Mn family superoxide dismutase